MSRFLSSLCTVGTLGLVLTGCPSQPAAKAPVNAPVIQPETPSSPEVNSVQAEKNGFSPGADAPANFLTFDLKFTYTQDVQSWKVALTSANNVIQRTLRGTSDKLSPTITWDGKADNGQLAPEGKYTAVLTVDYGTRRPSDTQTSKPFVLDVTPPSGSVSINPDPFTPTGDPAKDKLTLHVATKDGGGQVVSWRLQVVDQDGVVFKSFISEEHRDGTIDWDGRADSNGLLKNQTTYNVVLKIFDEWGNRAEADNTLVVGLAAVKAGDRMEIPTDAIIFHPFTADYKNVRADLAKRNLETLDKLAQTLKTFGKVTVLVDGYANKVYWYDKRKGDLEQKYVLIPLSMKRAEAVRQALVDRGIPADRLKLFAFGAENPVVSFDDYANTWQNRRVSFYLP